MSERTDWVRKFRDAGRGIAVAVRTQVCLRVHLAVTVVVVAAGVLLGMPPWHLALVAAMCALVIALEMVNSALEELVKGHVSEPSEFAGRALAMSAGAVLVASIGAVVVGALVFGQRIVELLRAAGSGLTPR